jgi:hypothetical protein
MRDALTGVNGPVAHANGDLDNGHVSTRFNRTEAALIANVSPY